ncbi:HET domain containing protein [Hyaloscypha variabilis]
MSRKPCICHPLHKNCDPALCLEARKGKWRERWGMKASKVISNIKTRLEIPSSSQKIAQPTVFWCDWTSLADAADSQCPTCQTLRTGVDLFESWTPSEDRQRFNGPDYLVTIEPPHSHDAIIITQKLGLEYIWIDSLCIIQDDASDWEIESALMGDVYGNATITIAAVTSKDGDGGCFIEVKKPLVYDHPNLPKETSMTIRKHLTHEAYHPLRVDQEKDCPLFSRAWTLQEELLAPRVLYFDAQEVIFQCRATLDCQCGLIQKELDGYDFKTTKQAFAKVFGRYLAYQPSLPMFLVQKSWASIVTQYSGRYLTREGDRFPALSGLAKTYENRGLGTYIAGLWTNDIALWLAWELRSPIDKDNPRRQISYVAPSWSWASRPTGDAIDYRIFRSYGLDVDLSFLNYPHILATNCELAGHDPTGAIKSASLSLRGRLVSAVLKVRILNDGGDQDQMCQVQRAGWEASADIDSPQQGGEFSVLDGQGVFYLLLCNVKTGVNYPRDSTYYLILDHGDQAGQYKRIGIGDSCEVCLSEDCERSQFHRPGLVVDNDWDDKNRVRSRPIMEEWFNDAEERELPLV